MVRCCHALLAHGHALWQYVDDLLAWWDKSSSPLWVSLVVVLLLILGVPMSWHKAALADTVDWIGWRISVSTWTVAVPPGKLVRIVEQIKPIQKSRQLTLRDLQSLVCRLLWLTSAWHYLRPLLIPPCKALRRIPTTMVGMDHVTFHSLVQQLDDQLQLTASLTHKHQSLRPGITLVRIANSNVQPLDEVVGILDPTSPHRKLDGWCGHSYWSPHHVPYPCALQCRSPSRRHLTLWPPKTWLALVERLSSMMAHHEWFQFRIQLDEARALWPWIGKDMQIHIAAWELLAQFALSFCIDALLPRTRGPIMCHQATDNSAADAASAKGLTMTRALAAVLAPYFTFMRRFQVVFPLLLTSLGASTCWLMN